MRRTEDVLDQANQRLIKLQQASAIVQNETLAKYMLEARGVPTTPIEKSRTRVGTSCPHLHQIAC
ncbi:MAG: hypothetical protein ACREO5_15380 [Candidatus Binatia bacterium]